MNTQALPILLAVGGISILAAGYQWVRFARAKDESRALAGAISTTIFSIGLLIVALWFGHVR